MMPACMQTGCGAEKLLSTIVSRQTTGNGRSKPIHLSSSSLSLSCSFSLSGKTSSRIKTTVRNTKHAQTI